MTLLEEKLDVWNKINNERQNYIKETDKDLKDMHLKNFWFGLRAYVNKYHEKFNHLEKPK
jgi:hypothetical protein